MCLCLVKTTECHLQEKNDRDIFCQYFFFHFHLCKSGQLKICLYLFCRTENKGAATLEDAFKKLCVTENKAISSKSLKVLGHKIKFNNTCGSILCVSFKDLCEKVILFNRTNLDEKYFKHCKIKTVSFFSRWDQLIIFK